MKLKLLVTAACILATTAVQAAQVNLNGIVNADLNTDYTNGDMYPPNGGTVNVNAQSFSLATVANGDTGVVRADFDQSSSFNIPVGIFGITDAYTLINSGFGSDGFNIGTVRFNGFLNTFDYVLTEGFNVRDHFQGFFVNSTTSADVEGTAFFGDGSVRLDMQHISLPTAFALDLLVSIDFIGNGLGVNGQPFLAALNVTTEAVVATPLPATLPLFAGGLGVLGLLSRRRKKAQAAA